MNLKKKFGNFNENFRILHDDPSVYKVMSEKIISWLPDIPREYVVICVGTDRSTGDSLGPLTGSFLKEKKPRHMTIYGTLHNPVHATNLIETIETIELHHRNPYIIAIDACLGKSSSIGHLIASKGPLKPGAALNKPLPEVGNMHITAVVNIGGYMEYSVLQNTRLSIVMDMAHKIANVLEVVDHRLKFNYSIPAVVTRKMQEDIKRKV